MFDKILDTYEQNFKIATSFIYPEQARKMVSDIVTANFGLAREYVALNTKFGETMTEITAKSMQ